MMPVVFARNAFCFVVGVLEIICGLEAVDGFLHSANAAKIVSVHVVSMRNIGSEPLIGFSMDQRLIDLADILVRVDQIMVGGKIIGLKLKDFVVPVYGFVAPTLAASTGIIF